MLWIRLEPLQYCVFRLHSLATQVSPSLLRLSSQPLITQTRRFSSTSTTSSEPMGAMTRSPASCSPVRAFFIRKMWRFSSSQGACRPCSPQATAEKRWQGRDCFKRGSLWKGFVKKIWLEHLSVYICDIVVLILCFKAALSPLSFGEQSKGKIKKCIFQWWGLRNYCVGISTEFLDMLAHSFQWNYCGCKANYIDKSLF